MHFSYIEQTNFYTFSEFKNTNKVTKGRKLENKVPEFVLVIF